MATRKFLYVDANGDYIESAGAYETSDFINTSAGAGDAGKPIVLDADGNIDATMINDADIDHGSIGGLADDDHTQYHNDTRGDARYYTQTILGSTSNGEGASLIGVEDSAGYFTATDVEGVLAELYGNVNGVSYTVGTGGVSKGDLVYVSANDTVVDMDDITAGVYGIGLALSTEIATASVLVARNDLVCTGVLTGATAGDKYYWNGTAHSTTIPATSGNYVWQTGVAKNATDLHVEVNFVKKNA